MKKGQSYIVLTDKNYDHPIIKKLKDLGYFNMVLIYASHMATDCGWTLTQYSRANDKVPKIEYWLGYTKIEVLRKLENIKPTK